MLAHLLEGVGRCVGGGEGGSSLVTTLASTSSADALHLAHGSSSKASPSRAASPQAQEAAAAAAAVPGKAKAEAKAAAWKARMEERQQQQQYQSHAMGGAHKQPQADQKAGSGTMGDQLLQRQELQRKGVVEFGDVGGDGYAEDGTWGQLHSDDAALARFDSSDEEMGAVKGAERGQSSSKGVPQQQQQQPLLKEVRACGKESSTAQQQQQTSSRAAHDSKVARQPALFAHPSPAAQNDGCGGDVSSDDDQVRIFCSISYDCVRHWTCAHQNVFMRSFASACTCRMISSFLGKKCPIQSKVCCKCKLRHSPLLLPALV